MNEIKCPICGKTFIAAPYHIYKFNNDLVCTYTCMLKAEKKKGGKKNDRV